MLAAAFLMRRTVCNCRQSLHDTYRQRRKVLQVSLAYNNESVAAVVEGCPVADDLDKLLRHIARNYTGPQEAREVERDDPNIPAEALKQERQRLLRTEERRAHELADAFRAGISQSHLASRAGGDAISLDDRDPEQNRIADALVHFLVGPGIATSRTRATGPQHYIYTIWIDWPQLRNVAREAGIDLNASIRQVDDS